ASITDPKKKRVDAIIREISNWPESYTNVSRYNNEPSEDIFNPLNDNRVVGRGGRFKIQIIIVDDDQGTTLPFKLGLESQGFAVDTFNDPKLALSHFHSGSYDLALIDVRMEGMNGFELVQEMKQIDKKLKVCFITSFTAYYDSLIQEYPNMEHKCFIQKPISIDDLIKHMERVLHY
ncbi:MAG TPA: response regulator, partial [Nitrososphaeraceae archaeon]|nr:response regulator [Nitrososphaeraceae archaeon]